MSKDQLQFPTVILNQKCNYFNFLVEMATLTRVNDKTVIKILTNAEMDALFEKDVKIEAAIEAAKKR